MKKLTLSKYCEKRTHSEVAEALGVSRAAVGQMLSGDREIYVEVSPGKPTAEITAWERRPIPARKPVAAA